eukprot:2449052-Amphidinium_carterae.1
MERRSLCTVRYSHGAKLGCLVVIINLKHHGPSTRLPRVPQHKDSLDQHQTKAITQDIYNARLWNICALSGLCMGCAMPTLFCLNSGSAAIATYTLGCPQHKALLEARNL